MKALDVSSRFYQPQGVMFEIWRRTKTMSSPVFYPMLDEFPKICIVRCLKEYESIVAEFSADGVDQLLISYVKPFRAVSTATIARWVKAVMKEAGVNLSCFSAHSVRGAMASKVFVSGGSLNDILKAADWSNAEVFRRYYFKPIEHVANKVLVGFEHA